jgi:hypothetical protein
MAISRLTTGNKSAGSGTITSLAYSAAQTSGSFLVALVVNFNASVHAGDVSVSDPTNVTWNKAYSNWFTWGVGSYGYAGIFYVNNTATSTLTVSIGSYSSGEAYAGVIIEEFTGLATSSPVDVSGNALVNEVSGTGQTATGPTLATTVDGDLIFAAMSDYYGQLSAISAGSGFTMPQSNTSPYYSADEYEVQSTHGNIAPTFTYSAGASNVSSMGIIAVAFKAAGGGGSLNQVQENLWFSRNAYQA